MNNDFPRLITLLRKEKGLSQRAASDALGVSQALLSHYERGVRECGLDFLVRISDFYGVSSDYLLGRTSVRSMKDAELPPDGPPPVSPEVKGSVFPSLGKAFTLSSVNVLFEMLKSPKLSKMATEAQKYLSIAIYKVFRYIYETGENDPNFFALGSASLPEATGMGMLATELRLKEAAAEVKKGGEGVSISYEDMITEHKSDARALFNIVKNAENDIVKGIRR